MGQAVGITIEKGPSSRFASVRGREKRASIDKGVKPDLLWSQNEPL